MQVGLANRTACNSPKQITGKVGAAWQKNGFRLNVPGINAGCLRAGAWIGPFSLLQLCRRCEFCLRRLLICVVRRARPHAVAFWFGYDSSPLIPSDKKLATFQLPEGHLGQSTPAKRRWRAAVNDVACRDSGLPRGKINGRCCGYT